MLVSDFYTPHYFDPVKSTAVRYSFTGAITAPLTILRGGYLSWIDPISQHMWQQVWFGNTKEFRDLGAADLKARALRAHVDRLTVRKELIEGRPRRKAEGRKRVERKTNERRRRPGRRRSKRRSRRSRPPKPHPFGAIVAA